MTEIRMRKERTSVRILLIQFTFGTEFLQVYDLQRSISFDIKVFSSAVETSRF